MGCQNRDFGPRHSAFARPPGAGGKGRAHPTICGAERGVYGVERAGPQAAHAAGALYRAGSAIPCANHRLSEPGFWSAALCIRPPGGGLAARAGRTRLYAGQRGAHAVWNGPARCRRARRERSTGQGDRRCCSRPTRDFWTHTSQRHCISAPSPPGLAARAGAAPGVCGAEWGGGEARVYKRRAGWGRAALTGGACFPRGRGGCAVCSRVYCESRQRRHSMH